MSGRSYRTRAVKSNKGNLKCVYISRVDLAFNDLMN